MCQLKRPSFPVKEVKTRHFLCFPCRSCRSNRSHTNVRTPDSLVWRWLRSPPDKRKEPGVKWRSISSSSKREALRGKETHRCASTASPPALLKTKVTEQVGQQGKEEREVKRHKCVSNPALPFTLSPLSLSKMQVSSLLFRIQIIQSGWVDHHCTVGA